jgi:peptidoglycan/xylan/chitin deacetylase (PgdA/CDA1 family)
MLPRLVPLLHQRVPQMLWHGDRAHPSVALTFDDGPHDLETPLLLKVLEEYHVRASFFLVGERLEAQQRLVRTIHDSGHQIGLHGYRHRLFDADETWVVERELLYTHRMITQICDHEQPRERYVRPPFGLIRPTTLHRLTGAGYRLVMGDNLPVHWAQELDRTVRQLCTHVHNGSVIILHEGVGNPPGWRIAEAIVPRLLAAGFEFVTVDELWRRSRKHQPEVT